MSNWMISHACSTIITPIIAALGFCLILAISSGNFVNLFDGAWILMFYLFILFFITYPILLFISFFQDINGKSNVIPTFCIVTVVSLLAFTMIFGFSDEGELLFFATIMTIGILYTAIQFIISSLLRTKFLIINEDITN